MRSEPFIQTWVWRVAPPGPPLTAAILVGSALRAAVNAAALKRGMSGLPDTFHHGGDDPSHPHAYWLSDDSDFDGVIDHVLVFAKSGIETRVLKALVDVDAIEVCGRKIGVDPLWMGPRSAGGLFGPARRWRSLTPYATKKRRTRGGRKHRASEKISRLLNFSLADSCPRI